MTMTTAPGSFPTLLRRLMGERGYSLRRLAREIPMDPGHLSRILSGKRPPTRDLVLRLGQLLGDGSGLAAAAAAEADADARQQERRTDPATLAVTLSGTASGLETVPAILQRLLRQQQGRLSPEFFAVCDAYLHGLPQRYEDERPVDLAAELVAQRQLVEELRRSVATASQRQRLLSLAARLSAALAYAAVDLGAFSASSAYHAEAMAAARDIGDTGLIAWLHGTASFSAYYQGDYPRALALAEHGLSYGDDTQAVRLLVNGVARAAGQLGERRTVDVAVNLAWQTLAEQSPPEGMSPSLSWDVYSPARVAANAATAYLALGDARQALADAEASLVAVDTAPSPGSKVLVRLDMATALSSGHDRDLERATALTAELMALADQRSVEPVRLRAGALATSLHASGYLPAVKQADDLTSWLQRGGSLAL
jgi:transcriptional regulator with XRE-family HTH domain